MIKLEDYITQVTFFTESFTTSAVLVCALLLSKKEWAWWGKVWLVFAWALGSCYIFSWAFAYYLPDLYAHAETFAVATSGILGFLFLIWAIDRNTFFEVFEMVKNKKLSDLGLNSNVEKPQKEIWE